MISAIRRILSFAIIFSLITTNFCWAQGERHADIESDGRVAAAKQIPLKTVKAAYKGDPKAQAEIRARLENHVRMTIEVALQLAQTLEAAGNPQGRPTRPVPALEFAEQDSSSDGENASLLARDSLIIHNRRYKKDTASYGAESGSSLTTLSPLENSPQGSPESYVVGSASSQESSTTTSSPSSSSGSSSSSPSSGSSSSDSDDKKSSPRSSPDRAGNGEKKEHLSGNLPRFDALASLEATFYDSTQGSIQSLQTLPPINDAEPNAEIDPVSAKKVMAFLNYFERYLIKNRTTWKQRAGVVGAIVLSAAAAQGAPTVFLDGVFYLSQKLGIKSIVEDYPSTEIPLIVNTILISFIDMAGRHILLAKELLAPSQSKFTHRNSTKEYLTRAGALGLALVPAFIGFYYLLAPELRNLQVAPQYKTNIIVMLSTSGVCYFLDGYTWAVRLVKGSLGSFYDFLMPKSDISPQMTRPIETKRTYILHRLSGLKDAIFWMPKGLLREIYDTLFDPNLESSVQSLDPTASATVVTLTKAIMQLNYLLSLSTNFKKEEEHSKTFSQITKIISLTNVLPASPMRFLALELIFSVMLNTLSGGYIPLETAGKIAITPAILGSIPQGAAEHQGNMEFSERFLSREPHTHSAFPILRAPAMVAALGVGAYMTTPLISLSLQASEEYLGDSNLVFALLAIPFIFPEYTSSAASLFISYVDMLPYMIGKIGRKTLSLLFGLKITAGEMRDEVIILIEKLEKIISSGTDEIIEMCANFSQNEEDGD